MESKGVKPTGNDEFNENEIIKRQNEIINKGDAQCAYCGKHLTEKEVYYTNPSDINWIFCSRSCAISTFTDRYFALKKAGIIKKKKDEGESVNFQTIFVLENAANSRRKHGKGKVKRIERTEV